MNIEGNLLGYRFLLSGCRRYRVGPRSEPRDARCPNPQPLEIE